MAAVIVSSWGCILGYTLHLQHQEQMECMEEIKCSLIDIRTHLDNIRGDIAEDSYNIRNTLDNIKNRIQ